MVSTQNEVRSAPCARRREVDRQVPAEFTTSDGYLSPNLDPDYDDGETGYLDVVDALERLDNGESYRSVASDTIRT